MTHLGETLPAGWAAAALGELGVWSGGGTPSKKKHEYWEGGDVPWVSPKDMGPIHLEDAQDRITTAAATESPARVVPGGSIAFVVRSGILNRTLPIAQVPFDAAFNQDMRVLTPASSLNSGWLLWALLAAAPDIRQRCRKDGVTVASIEVPRLMEYELPLPPRAEQDRLVALVSAQLQGAASGRASLSSALSGVGTLRAALLHQTLWAAPPAAVDAGDIEETLRCEREDAWEQANEASGRRRRYKPPVDAVPIDVELPPGWRVLSVDAVGSLVTDGDHNPRRGYRTAFRTSRRRT